MAETILNSLLHEREHYNRVSVRPIALLLERSECNNAFGQTQAQLMLERVQYGVSHGFSHVINLLLLLYYFKPIKILVLITVY